METRANYIAVGLFVLLVLTGALGFVYWLYSAGNTTQRTALEILFHDPVTGLAVGSPVVFNGIRIGEVSQLGFVSSDSPTVLARVQVDRNAPIKKDTKAELGVQGLTGVSYVSLSGGDAKSPSIFDDDTVPEITAQRSAIQDLLQGARDILVKTDSTIGQLNELIQENKGKISRTVSNVETFSNALAQNSDKIDRLLTDISDAGAAIAKVAPHVESLVSRADSLVAEVKPEDVQRITANIVAFTDRLGEFSGQFRQVVESVTAAAGDLQQFASGLNTSLTDVNKLIEAVDPTTVKSIVEQVNTVATAVGKRSDDIDSFIADAKASAENIRTVTQSLSDQNGDIQAIIATTRSVTDRADTLIAGLQPSVDRVDGLLAAIDATEIRTIIANVSEVTQAIAGRSEDISAIIVNAKETATSARAFADRLDAQKDTIDQVANNARDITDKLNAASTRVNAIVDNVGDMVEGDGQGLIKEATEAARAIKVVAQAFESRAGTISSGLERFSTTGVDDFRGVMTQARQTLLEIERAFSNIDRDPSRVIFGGPNGPRYQPQRR
jgi:phospholipid/cholesterol/gamma-HCH transport system substrate-binding protein